MSRMLVDTGPLVALIDKSDQNHQRCLEWFKYYHGRLYSTEAVLTEAMYLLNFSFSAQAACLNFFIAGAIELHPISPQELDTIEELMEQYQNVPMDYADATLVNLAKEMQCYSIFTLDVTDFSIYRPDRNHYFEVLPA